LEEVIIIKYKHKLGGGDYYHLPGTVVVIPERITPIENVMEKAAKTTPAGRGSA
jgi:hypothetical protein